MTIFSSAFMDEQVREQMNSNFSFLTGSSRPMVKSKGKNAEDITPEMWFRELSWVHCFIFCQAFHEAVARGIVSPIEKAMGEQLIAMMP